MIPGSEIASTASSGEKERFLSLFMRSQKDIFRYVAVLVPNLSDAEDIVQQTALALWLRFDAYDPAQPFTPWACRFALNKARKWIKQRERWRELLDKGLAEELSRRREELGPELEIRLKNLESCVRKLPESQRVIVEGYYYRSSTVEELAALTSRTVAATYKSLQRIRSALQLCVERTTPPKGFT